jgi:hypothetical protein
MHPNLINDLARQRHCELLQEQEFRNIGAGGSPSVRNLTRTPIRHVRHTLGSALVLAGTRLMTPGPPQATS